jgi:ABC-2 type transport system ATP-binding protein
MLTPAAARSRSPARSRRLGRRSCARVGFVAQDTPVYARMSVAGHLRLGAWLNPGRDEALARRWIGQLALDPKQRFRGNA